MRTCRVCQEVKSDDLFVKQMRNGKSTVRNTCKVCKNKKDAERRDPAKRNAQIYAWREANKDKAILIRKRSHWKMQGIDPDLAEEYYLAHDGKCEICGLADGWRDLAMDHCHQSGKIRGMLCANCNRGLGHLKESIPNLEKAIAYLKTHQL